MKTFLFIAVFALVSLTASSQSPTYEVYALKFGQMKNSTLVSKWAMHAPAKDSVNMFFVIWLVKGSNGRNILVDAGFLKDIEEAKNFSIANYVRPDSTLSKLGLRPEEITDIILSHPHWDHADGIDLFPNARVWMQKEDYGYLVGSAWQEKGNHGGFNKRDVRKLLEINLAGRLMLVDGDDKEIIPGIKVYTGSKHTFNSQFVQVNTGKDRVILASDNIWIYYNLEHMASAPTYGTSDTTAYVKSMQRMKTLASEQKLIIPGHDARMFLDFPKVKEGVVRIK